VIDVLSDLFILRGIPMKEGVSKSARSAVALTAAPWYCCAPTVSRFKFPASICCARSSVDDQA
jgi:hypothetical protein